jgi:serine kinase of HPr protein (carbohydrate metabolism regulator)
MPSETSFAIHATAVAIGDWGVVIRGASRSGKSTLALNLIAASGANRSVTLVGDDRLIVSQLGSDVFVAPHPKIAGLIEKRGEGILAMAYRAKAPVRVIVDLDVESGTDGGCVRTCDFAGKNFPTLQFVKESRWDARHARVLEWFAATSVAHSGLKCGLNGLHA